MNAKNRISMAVAVLAAVGTVAFVPASADSPDEAINRAAGAIVAQVATETPQDQVWDMTYGAERPTVDEETTVATAEDASIEDYTFG
ncbi:MAG: hypothetical protein OEX21_08705 [Betaproteobacteria bacterium]|nr:hypothetical protein [Betaproteobacteria bacterium]